MAARPKGTNNRSVRQKTKRLAESDPPDQVSGPINWLAHLDRKAARLRRRANWSDLAPYCFWFIRYSHLRLDAPPDALQQELKKREAEIRGADLRILGTLSPDLRQQLAALVCDTINDFERFRDRQRTLTRLRNLRNDQGRKLAAKVKGAITAVSDLHSYAWNLDPWLREPTAGIAKKFLVEINVIQTERRMNPRRIADWADLHIRMVTEDDNHPVPDDPTSSGMVKLYWFFHHGCELNTDEAEVRTALVRNALWTEYADAVRFVPTYTGSESAGCDAVRKAVTRFRPS